MRLAELQTRMQADILEPRAVADDGMRIHHRHFWHRMHDFIARSHPLLARFLGGPELVQLVHAYIVAHPPIATVGLQVGAQLARFLATCEPWKQHPIIGALAAYDFARSAAANSAEELAVSRDELAVCRLDPRVTVRLKKRTALVTTHYRFHTIAMAHLRRTDPLDASPTYVLVHMVNRKPQVIELDHRLYLALECLARGASIRTLIESWRSLGLGDVEIETLLTRCIDAELVVADID